MRGAARRIVARSSAFGRRHAGQACRSGARSRTPRADAAARRTVRGGLRFFDISSTSPRRASTATASQSRGPSGQRNAIDQAGCSVAPSRDRIGSSSTHAVAACGAGRRCRRCRRSAGSACRRASNAARSSQSVLRAPATRTLAMREPRREIACSIGAGCRRPRAATACRDARVDAARPLISSIAPSRITPASARLRRRSAAARGRAAAQQRRGRDQGI